MGMIGDIFGGGDDAGDASIKAADIQAQYQREALQYLKEREAIPQQFREGSLQQLAGAYGLSGGASGDEFIRSAQGSPIYKAIMGNLPEMEEAVLRNQSATGALRTGATDMMLAENQRNLRGQALGGVLGGLQGMANLPSLAPAIAGQTSGIGQTLAQGQIGAAQSQQAGQQQGFGNLMGLGALGLSAYDSGLFCDPRLKSNPVKIGEFGGVQIYEWEWNDAAEKLGLRGKGRGPMADEIQRRWPAMVTEKNGYMYVRAAA